MAEEAVTPRLKWLATRILAIFAVWVTLAHLDVVQAAESNVFENPAVAARLISAEEGSDAGGGRIVRSHERF